VILVGANSSAFKHSSHFVRTALRIGMHVHETPALLEQLNDDAILSVTILRLAMHVERVDETLLHTSDEYVARVRTKRRKGAFIIKSLCIYQTYSRSSFRLVASLVGHVL